MDLESPNQVAGANVGERRSEACSNRPSLAALPAMAQLVVRQGNAMTTPSAIPVGKRIVLSFLISWVAAVSLGIIFGARAVGVASPAQLWVMLVVQVATIVASVVALFLTPLVAWSVSGCRSVPRVLELARGSS
jgi:hypothetical protein